MRLAAKFNSYYAERPGKILFMPPFVWLNGQLTWWLSLVLTTMVTNAVRTSWTWATSSHLTNAGWQFIGAWWCRRYSCTVDHSLQVSNGEQSKHGQWFDIHWDPRAWQGEATRGWRAGSCKEHFAAFRFRETHSLYVLWFLYGTAPVPMVWVFVESFPTH